MYDSQEKLWSDNPNTPKIPYNQYFQEKVTFAGDFVGPILYGTRKGLPTRMSTYPYSLRLFGLL